MANVKDIEGIGPVLAGKLEKAGIVTVESLLESGATRSGRTNIAKESGISESQILEFVNMADLMRVKGVGAEFAELLKAAGVDTIKELRTRNAENLHKKLEEVNKEKSLTRRVPSLDMVTNFIAQAGSTDPSITY
jgi:predicted flap endonuclease-1-like 5' DNA nuclease